MELVSGTASLAVVYGEEEVHARTAHLFAAATDMACAANDLFTWAATRPRPDRPPPRLDGKRIRKIFRPAVLLDPSGAEHVRELDLRGAEIRISTDEISETVILDRRIAILAGEYVHGARAYSVISRPEVVHGVTSLFEAAWRSATDLATHDARFAEIRQLAPQILDLLATGCKDETAARTLGLGLRTYRRRVAELMTALGATSRFQAGARARELGVI